MNKLNSVVSDKDMEKAFGNSDFGGLPPRSILKFGLLKVVCGFYQGYTSKTILNELNLIDSNYKITTKGREYLWQAFKENSNKMP